MEDSRKRARKPRAAATAKPAATKQAGSAKAAARARPARTAPVAAGPSPAEREAMVRTAAYFRAQRRGFQPGYEWEDWLAAEAEVAALAQRPAVAKRRRTATATTAKDGKTGKTGKTRKT